MLAQKHQKGVARLREADLFSKSELPIQIYTCVYTYIIYIYISFTIASWWKSRGHLSLNVEKVLEDLSDTERYAIHEFLQCGYSTILDLG